MSLRGKLKCYELTSGTKVIRIWKDLELADKPTGAASRLILIDTKGEIPPDKLCEWLSKAESLRRLWEKSENAKVV